MSCYSSICKSLYWIHERLWQKESSHLKYWDKNNLYGWAMSQKLKVNGFKRVEDLSEFDEGFPKSYNEKVKKGIFLKLMLDIPKRYMSSIMTYHVTWKNEYWKSWKVFANVHDKNQYVIHIRNLKQGLNHWLVFQKMHRVIKFNQKAWLKSCIEMNTEVRKKSKKWFRKILFQVNKQFSFWKSYGKWKEAQRHQICNNRKKNKLFTVRTKLSQHNVFHWKFAGNRNEENSNVYE